MLRGVGMLVLSTLLVVGCKITQIVPEGGRIVSRTGELDCPGGQTCEVIKSGTPLSDTFTAVPDPGYRFEGWKQAPAYLCGGSTAPCAVENISPALTALDVNFFLEPLFSPGLDVAYSLDDGLLSDGGAYPGIGAGSLSHREDSGRSFLELGDSGLVTLPAALSAAVFAHDSVELAFDFRIPDSSGEHYEMLLSATGDGSATGWWLFDAGFTLHVHSNGQDSEFILSLSDGREERYYWLGAPGLEPGAWSRVVLRLYFAERRWSMSRNGVNEQGLFDESFEFDMEAFQAALTSTPLTVGGVNGVKVEPYNGAFDIDELWVSGPLASGNDVINETYSALLADFNGSQALDEAAREALLATLIATLPSSTYSEISAGLLAYTEAYEAENLPLYLDGQTWDFDQLPFHARVLQVSQQHVLNRGFVAGNLAAVEGISFEHAEVMPGLVHADAERIASATVAVDGSYARDPAAELTDQDFVVRPTGFYAAPGELVTIRAPQHVIDQGLSIRVGAHFRNMDYAYIGGINRFPDISTEFSLDATTIQVANPLGGGIYLNVPEGITAGEFTLTIEGAVSAPYFSWREGKQTDVAEWLQSVSQTGAPWADFESDKFMFTVPTSFLEGVSNPDAIMARWDEIMDAIRHVAGRPATRPRAEYYAADSRLVTPAFGAGYPMVIPVDLMQRNDEFNPLAVLGVKPESVVLHEMGHNHLHPTLDFGEGYDSCAFIEAETVVHTLALSVYSQVYGYSIDDAFTASFWNGLTPDEAAFDWIITSNFRSNLAMIYDDSAPLEDRDMLKYQPRGWAKYGDIARLFGFEGLGAVNGMFYIDGEEQESDACPERPFIVGRDEYIRAASEALGVNMAPLFHFWGIVPSESLSAELNELPRSRLIYDQLTYYRDTVLPRDKAAYQAFHDRIYPKMDYQRPRYDLYQQEFNSSYVAEMDAQFALLLATYFPEGRPAGN